MKMFSITVCLSLILLQNSFSKTATDYGIQYTVSSGTALSMEPDFETLSHALSLNIIKNRFTIRPYIESGYYTNTFITDIRYISYCENGLGIILQYTFWKKWNFGFSSGVGVFGANINGKKEAWTSPFGTHISIGEETINEYRYWGAILGDIRLGFRKSRFGIHFQPLNVAFNDQYFKWALSIGFDYQFKRYN